MRPIPIGPSFRYSPERAGLHGTHLKHQVQPSAWSTGQIRVECPSFRVSRRNHFPAQILTNCCRDHLPLPHRVAQLCLFPFTKWLLSAGERITYILRTSKYMPPNEGPRPIIHSAIINKLEHPGSRCLSPMSTN